MDRRFARRTFGGDSFPTRRPSRPVGVLKCREHAGGRSAGAALCGEFNGIDGTRRAICTGQIGGVGGWDEHPRCLPSGPCSSMP
jgi:hypothetical protein